MALSDPLPLALQKTVVFISSEAGTGTGFFIAPQTVLTCEHVVGNGSGPVRGLWNDRELELHRDGRPRGDNPPDLALLRLEERLAHPFAALAPSVSLGDELWTWGFPAGPYSSGDAVTLRYDGPSQRHDGELIRASGARLTPGFSGAPVLNQRTGGVCGVVRLGEKTDPTVRLVPADMILDIYKELARHHQPPHTNTTWLDLLGNEQLRAGKWRYPGPLLLAYLEALRGSVRSHPYAVSLPSAPPLSGVYLRQRGLSLQRDVEEESLISLPGPGSASQEADGNRELFTRHRNTLIIGRPGAGKSSLLRYVADTASLKWLRDREGEFVPAYVPARALTSGKSFTAALVSAVNRELGMWLDTSLPEDWFSDEPMPGVPWLLLVDGVDEILAAGSRREALSAIVHRRGAENYRFLVASRPLPDQELDQLLNSGTGAYEILPFSPDQLLALAEGWFKALKLHEPRTLAERFRTELDRSRIAHLARVPLLATMLCVVFAEHPEQGIPHSRADLYERFVALLMSKQYQQVNIYQRLDRRAEPFGPAARHSVRTLLENARYLLERLAAARHRGDQRPFLSLALAWTEPLRPSCVPIDEWSQILQDILRQSGVMVQRQGEFVFLHQTVEEYLAALYCAYGLSADVANYLVFSDGEQSYRQFLAAACLRTGISFNAGAMRVLRHGGADKVMFVAALLRDGAELSDNVRTAVVNRLSRMSTAATGPNSISMTVRINAAHELAYLSPEKGLTPLRNIAENQYLPRYDRVQAARQLVELDFALGVRLLDELVDTHPVSDDCLRAARHLLEFDASLGLAALDRLARNTGLNGWTRLDVAMEIDKWNSNRSHDALVALAVDPSLQLMCQLSARDLLRAHPLPSPRGLPATSPLTFVPDLAEIPDFQVAGQLLLSANTRDLVAVLADPDFDASARDWLIATLSEAQEIAGLVRAAEVLIEDAVCVIRTAGVPLFPKGEVGALRTVTVSRLASKLERAGDHTMALTAMVRMQVQAHRHALSPVVRQFVNAVTLGELGQALLENGSAREARTAVDAMMATLRALAKLSQSEDAFDDQWTAARALRAAINGPMV